MKQANSDKDYLPNSRKSNRIYPSRECKNPDCSVTFTPTNKRQKYCFAQHRIDYNNDLRSIKEKPFKLLGKKLNHNLAVLIKIDASLKANNLCSFSFQLLQYELYNFGIFTDKSINKETENEIEWCFNYGIEVKDPNKQTFIIHFKK